MPKPHIPFFLFCLCALAPASAWATSVTLPTVADTFVTSADPSNNYGAAGAMEISAPGSSAGELQTLLMFNLSSAVTTFNATYGAGNWSIDSITLQLGTNFGTQGQTVNNPIFNNINAGLFKIDLLANNNWAEGTGTPMSNTVPSNPPVNGATFGSLGLLESGSDVTLTNASTLGSTFTYTPVGATNPPTVPAALYNIGLNSNLVSDITSGGLASFRMYAGDTGVSYLFNAKEFPTTANHPELIIDAVPTPEPATASLFIFGALVGVALRRPRRSAQAV
ncbi:MAG: PEP-CTERM sorting domain-containing protein [Chthoniobacter sp.]|nr:PEP-CTERM sorting domain-containing protein [Chthoniobacter sp.]